MPSLEVLATTASMAGAATLVHARNSGVPEPAAMMLAAQVAYATLLAVALMGGN